MTDNKSWWEEELDFLKGDYDDNKPISSSWRSKLGHWSSAWGGNTIGASPKTERLSEAARRLASPANVVRNSANGDERTLKLAWSDGCQANSPEGETIYLSPDLLLSERKGSKNEELKMDAMTGQVLLAAAMKRTMSLDAWNHQVMNTGRALSGETTAVWRALETAVARREVLRDWQGWGGYFRRHAEETGAGKDEVQKAIDSLKPDVGLAACALAWDILYPTDKLALPRVYRIAMNTALGILNADIPARDRYLACHRAVEAMARALEDGLKQPPQAEPEPGEEGEAGSESEPSAGEPSAEAEDGEPKPGEEAGDNEEGPEAGGDVEDDATSEGDADQTGESGSDGSDESDGKTAEPSTEEMSDRPTGTAPTLTDASLFGETVASTTAAKDDLPAPVEVSDDQEEVEIVAPDGLPEHHSTTVCFIEERNPEKYMQMVCQVQPSINAIQAALRFRNNDRTMLNRGCTSGDLDEGSLDKLVLREDHPAIWERRELLGQPNVAVGLLLDESGSMAESSGAKIVEARKVCVAMSAALSKIRGVSLMLLGHTGDGGLERSVPGTKVVTQRQVKGTSTQVVILEYLTRLHKNPWGIVHAHARANNFDSFAMDYAVRKMMTDYANIPRRLLFVVSDGQPCGRNYSGEPAMQHMRQVCEFGRRNNVGVYGVGICNAYSPANGELMYGPGNFVVIRDVLSSIAILTAFLTQVAQRPV